MTVSIIIPSNKRHDKLQKCLLAIGNQILPPNERCDLEVIIIFAETDKETEKTLLRAERSETSHIYKVPIKDMSSLAMAINYGLKVATGDVVVFTDDDAIPDSDWLYKIVNTYKRDSTIGGVGGRDIVYMEEKEIKAKRVKSIGRLTLSGRVIGNHHQIVSKIQEVNFLKGCNMSVRRKLISLIDENILSYLRWEWDLCFQIANKGYKLIYDPKIQVKHIRTVNKLTARDLCFLSHNTTYILLKYLSWPRRIIFIVYTFLIGQRNDFGLVRSIVLFLSSPSMRVIDITYACLLGKTKGIATFLKNYAFFS